MNPTHQLLYILMGYTEARVFEKHSKPLTYKEASNLCWKLNQRYKQVGLAMRFYITPILDL